MIEDKDENNSQDVIEAAKFLDGLSKDQLRKLNRTIDIRETRLEFVKKFHLNTKGEKMDLVKFPHLIDWYESTADTICIIGAAQTGKSEFVVIDMLAASYLGCNIFVVLPKYEMRDIYATTRVKRPLMTSPHYKKIVQEGMMNSTQIIQFGKGMIKFVGANVESDFVEYAADMYVVEETDKITTWANVEMGYSRLQASIFKYKRFVSNPSTTDGKIEEIYKDSDQRVWKCRCKDCGEFHDLDWFKCVVEEIRDSNGNVIDYQLRDKEWKRGCGRDISVKCPHCKTGNIERFHPDNHWEATNPEGLYEGYRAPSLISVLCTVSELYDEFVKALSNPSKMQAFYNMRLGMSYSAPGNSVPVELLASCSDPKQNFVITPETAYIPGDCHPGPCSMGVDVAPTRLDVRISFNDKGKRRAVYFGKLSTDTGWDELTNLAERYNVAACVIDIGPEVDQTKKFADDANFDVWRCKYQGAGSERTMKLNHNDMIIAIDRTVALDKGYSQLKSKKNVLPANFLSIYDGLYSQEMTSLIRQMSEKEGNQKYEWVGSPQDHSRHSDAYDLLAHSLIEEDVLTIDNITIG